MSSERLKKAFALVENEPAEPAAKTIISGFQHTADQQPARLNAPLRQLDLIVEWLQRTGVRGDRATWGMRLLYRSRVLKDMPGSERLYRQMIKTGIRPDPYHVSAIIEGYCAAGLLQEAEMMLGAARQKKIATRHHYTMIICALGNAKDPKAGYRMFNRMVVDGVTPDFASVEAVVRGHFLLGQYGAGKRFLLAVWPQIVPQSVPGVMLKLDPTWDGRISTTNLHEMDLLRKMDFRELLMIFREIEDAMRARPSTDPYMQWRYRTDWKHLRDKAASISLQQQKEPEEPVFPVFRTSSTGDNVHVEKRPKLPPGQVYKGIFKSLVREWERTGRSLRSPRTVPVEAVQHIRDDLRSAAQGDDICEDGSERRGQVLTDRTKGGDSGV
jgi:pentatricopeptide repeat protein